MTWAGANPSPAHGPPLLIQLSDAIEKNRFTVPCEFKVKTLKIVVMDEVLALKIKYMYNWIYRTVSFFSPSITVPPIFLSDRPSR